MKVHWHDGGEYGDDYRYNVESLLHDNDRTYCSTKAKNVNIILKESEGRPFEVQRVVIRGPNDNFTSPIKDVLVLVSDEAPSSEVLQNLDNLHADDYRDRKEAGDDVLSKSKFVVVPDTNDSVVVHFPAATYGTHILIKCIRCHEDGEEYDEDDSNIDIEYVGIYGFELRSTASAVSESSPVYATRRKILSDSTAKAGRINQVGMRFFASLIQNLDMDGPSQIISASLSTIVEQLKKIKPLQLFSEWSPPRVPLQEALVLGLLGSEMVRASSEDSSPSHAPWHALKSNQRFWSSAANPVGDSAWWSVKLGKPARISSVAIDWNGSAKPSVLFIEMSDDEGKTWKSMCSVSEKRLTGDPILIPFDTPDEVETANVRLRMKGFGPKNRDKKYAIERVRIWKISTEDFISSAEIVSSIEAFLLRCHLNAKLPSSTRDAALDGLRYLALGSGSVCNLLQLVKLSRGSSEGVTTKADRAGDQAKDIDQNGERAILKALSKEIDVRTEQESARENIERRSDDSSKVAPAGSSKNSCKMNAAFDPDSLSHSGLLLSENNMYITCTTGSNAVALLDVGFDSGTASWEMLLAEDTSSQCTCFGVATKPVTNPNYERSPDLWMYRAYNGYTYNRGSRERTLKKINKGDTVRCELDMDAGTLRYFVEGEDQGIVFTNMKDYGTVYPAVAFYSKDRAVRLLSVECTSQEEPSYLCDLKYESVSCGRGNFAKPGFLGYVARIRNDSNDSGEDEIDEDVGDDDGSEIVVEKKKSPHSISLHPPSNGFSFVRYRISGRFDSLSSRVALNDSVDAAKLDEEGSPVTFEVLGDGKSLWKSKPITAPGTFAEFCLSLLDVDVLELRVHCPGPNIMCHAVWVNPVILYESKHSIWYRNMYGPIAVGKISSALTRSEARNRFAVQALQHVATLADIYMRRCRTAPQRPFEKSEAKLDLEEPFVIQVCPRFFRVALDLFRGVVDSLEKTSSRSSEIATYREMCDALLLIISANMQRLEYSYIEPTSVLSDEHDATRRDRTASNGGDSKIATTEEISKKDSNADSETRNGVVASNLPRYLCDLRDVLIRYTAIRSAEEGDSSPSIDPRTLAAETLRHGLFMFHPAKSDRISLATDAMKRCACLEFRMFWPVLNQVDGSSAQEVDKIGASTFRAYERAMILLQMWTRERNFKTCFMGEWMRIAHLVIEVPASQKNDFMRTAAADLAQVFRLAGFDKWAFPIGDVDYLPVRVEPFVRWNRKRRLAHSMRSACVHVYTEQTRLDGTEMTNTETYGAVCRSVKSFLRDFSP
eukprot:g395.t1